MNKEQLKSKISELEKRLGNPLTPQGEIYNINRELSELKIDLENKIKDDSVRHGSIKIIKNRE